MISVHWSSTPMLYSNHSFIHTELRICVLCLVHYVRGDDIPKGMLVRALSLKIHYSRPPSRYPRQDGTGAKRIKRQPGNSNALYVLRMRRSVTQVPHV